MGASVCLCVSGVEGMNRNAWISDSVCFDHRVRLGIAAASVAAAVAGNAAVVHVAAEPVGTVAVATWIAVLDVAAAAAAP